MQSLAGVTQGCEQRQVSESKVKDLAFIIKAKDLSFVFKTKAKDTVSLRTFQGLLRLIVLSSITRIFIGLK